MELLTEIQRDAVNQDVDVSTLLRKCKILAKRLNHEAFSRWVESELNGYSSKDEVPKYRVLVVQSFGTFHGPWGSGIKNIAIPDITLPEALRDIARRAFLQSGISTYESLVKGSEKKTLMANWPPNVLGIHGDKIMEDMVCVAAWQEVGANQIHGVIDTVRTRILSFVLELEKQVPDVGEVPSIENPISNDKITNMIQYYIYGNVGNIAVGSSKFSQASSIEIVPNDLQSLINYFKTQNINEADLVGLKKALKKDKKPINGKSFGKNVSGWIGKMVGKAASGVWKISTDVAAKVISEAILKYHGF